MGRPLVGAHLRLLLLVYILLLGFTVVVVVIGKMLGGRRIKANKLTKSADGAGATLISNEKRSERNIEVRTVLLF